MVATAISSADPLETEGRERQLLLEMPRQLGTRGMRRAARSAFAGMFAGTVRFYAPPNSIRGTAGGVLYQWMPEDPIVAISPVSG
jgi:hypothetical protein